MTERVVVERCRTPRGDLALQRRGERYEIISNGVFLAATDGGESERLLVRAALQATPDAQSIVIAGLGVGYSLAEALRHPMLERLVVVEVEEAVIRWHRSHLAPFSAHGCDDPHVEVVHADLADWLIDGDETFDVVALDVDNGPDWTVTEANRWLYTDAGAAALARRLSPGGALSVWSAAPAPGLAQRLAANGLADVRELLVPVARGTPDCVYLARRSSQGAAPQRHHRD